MMPRDALIERLRAILTRDEMGYTELEMSGGVAHQEWCGMIRQEFRATLTAALAALESSPQEAPKERHVDMLQADRLRAWARNIRETGGHDITQWGRPSFVADEAERIAADIEAQVKADNATPLAVGSGASSPQHKPECARGRGGRWFDVALRKRCSFCQRPSAEHDEHYKCPCTCGLEAALSSSGTDEERR